MKNFLNLSMLENIGNLDCNALLNALDEIERSKSIFVLNGEKTHLEQNRIPPIYNQEEIASYFRELVTKLIKSLPEGSKSLRRGLYEFFKFDRSLFINWDFEEDDALMISSILVEPLNSAYKKARTEAIEHIVDVIKNKIFSNENKSTIDVNSTFIKNMELSDIEDNLKMLKELEDSRQIASEDFLSFYIKNPHQIIDKNSIIEFIKALNEGFFKVINRKFIGAETINSIYLIESLCNEDNLGINISLDNRDAFELFKVFVANPLNSAYKKSIAEAIDIVKDIIINKMKREILK